MGCTVETRASAAASTALSRPDEKRTATSNSQLPTPKARFHPTTLGTGSWELGVWSLRLQTMYSVTKQLDFCYGHRLLDYEGVCKHPHGHNAVVELEIQADTLDRRNMVVDFTDIKRAMQGWIDRELDHRMILRRDDPLVGSLQSLGEPVYVLDSNPTVERIARLLFDVARQQGLPVARVTVWETPSSWATYRA